MIQLQNASQIEASGISAEKEIKDIKNQKIREFTVKLCFLQIPEVTPIKSH